ncbi:hypothetical protein K2X92_01880 [Candidatus Gracilibacteria bacterium]|nr:hypothetical protein [Candidatus Gracilibacteria bacterium]
MSLSISPISPIISIGDNHQRKPNNRKNDIKDNPFNNGSNTYEIITSSYVPLPISIVVNPLIQRTRENMNRLAGMAHYSKL